MEIATFAAGCFWGVQKEFMKVKGVISSSVGYMGGTMKNPTYEDVCTGKTGHAEVIQLTYDPQIILYEKLLDIFWKIHDPTTLNRQGVDVGYQYRSVIFYHNDNQKEIANRSKKKLEDSGFYKNPIVTEITESMDFYVAEDYHQNYLIKKGF